MEDVTVDSITLAAGRRLTEHSQNGINVLLQYRVRVGSSNEQTDLIETLHSAEFADEFGREVTSAEQVRAHGLTISEFSFVRLSSKSLPFAETASNDTSILFREALGNALDLYGNPLWANATLEAWQKNATPAVRAAVVKTISAQASLADGKTVSVSPGPLVVDPSYVRARFHIHAQIPPLEESSNPDGGMYREHFQSYYRAIDNLDSSENFQKSVLEELAASGVPTMPGMAFSASTYTEEDDDDAQDVQEAGGGVAVVVLVLLLTVFLVCLGTFSWMERLRIRKLTQWCFGGTQLNLQHNHKPDDAAEDCNKVTPFEDNFCVCGEEFASGACFCGKCGRSVGRGSVSIQTQTDSLTRLKFALHEIGEASKSLRNEFVVACTTPTSSCSSPARNRMHQNAMLNGVDLPYLVDEYRYARKLDYTDRPRAAKPYQYNLDDECHASQAPCVLARPSPASSQTTQVPDGASMLDTASSISPERSTWSSPQRSRIDSRPSTRRAGGSDTARSQGPLSSADDMEIIDVTDTESEDSRNNRNRQIPVPPLAGWASIRKPSKRVERQATPESRSLTNWTSMRIFRRTMASYLVAEDGSLPPKSASASSSRSKSQASRDLQGKQSSMHGLGTNTNRSSNSDKLEVIEVTEVIEITDL
jgi:hypothetical protein